MSNLSIERLNLLVGNGDLTGAAGVGSQSRATSELKANGLTPTDEQFGKEGASFGDLLKASIEQVNTHQAEADRSMKELVSGRTKNIHETMLTIERADSSLKLAMQVRNKILEAYREIMRMQV